MNLRILLFSIALIIAVAIIMQESVHQRVIRWLKEINVKRLLFIVILTFLAVLIWLFYPRLKDKIGNLRKNI